MTEGLDPFVTPDAVIWIIGDERVKMTCRIASLLYCAVQLHRSASKGLGRRQVPNLVRSGRKQP